MDFSLYLDPKEVLFHLNYMGYKNVTSIQLKEFMKDLKKLMKFESKESNEPPKAVQQVPAAPPNPTISNKHYDIPTVSSRIKERKIDKPKEKSRPNSVMQSVSDKPNVIQSEAKKQTRECHKIHEKNKENFPANKKKEAEPNAPPSARMWIRSKSAQAKRPQRKTDPVALYQAYQKDWERFRSQICESSHSDLRWLIRERMMGRD